jgi:hypothetical protein
MMRMVNCLHVPHNILNWWKNYFSELLNVHRVSDVGEKDIHIAEPIVPDTSPLDVKVLIEKLEKVLMTRVLSNPSRID